MGTVLGSILDPAADKLLMTTMVVTLTIQGMLPRAYSSSLFPQRFANYCLQVALGALILGRDVALSLSAFYFRYISLPAPVSTFRLPEVCNLILVVLQKTFSRYWDFSIPSAEVQPTTISKYNTALQLLLVGATTVGPLLPFEIALPLYGLQ